MRIINCWTLSRCEPSVHLQTCVKKLLLVISSYHALFLFVNIFYKWYHVYHFDANDGYYHDYYYCHYYLTWNACKQSPKVKWRCDFVKMDFRLSCQKHWLKSLFEKLIQFQWCKNLRFSYFSLIANVFLSRGTEVKNHMLKFKSFGKSFGWFSKSCVAVTFDLQLTFIDYEHLKPRYLLNY